MDSDEGERPDAGANSGSRAQDRVRARLARLGADTDSAPEPPAEVTARIGAALRAAPPPSRRQPAHAARAPLRRHRLLLIAGIGAAVLGVGLGALALTQRTTSVPSTELSAQHITVTRPAAPIPLPDTQLRALLGTPPDFGPLDDPDQRAGCLRALHDHDGGQYDRGQYDWGQYDWGHDERGQPDATVLGARPLDLDGTPAVLLLLPGATPETMTAVAVGPRCGPGDAAVLTERRNLRR